MRILFLSSYANPGAGSAILVRLASRLKERGHDVRILTTKQGYDSDLTESVSLSLWMRFVDVGLNLIGHNYFSCRYFPLLDSIKKYAPDLVNIHWTHGDTIPIGLIANLSKKWPVCWTMHDLWPITGNTFFEYTGGKAILDKPPNLRRRLNLKRRYTPSILFRYKVSVLSRVNLHTVSPSKWLQKKVDKSPVFSNAINHHLPNGVDINVFRPLELRGLKKEYGIAESDKVIIFLSANLADKRKGFYYFVKALEHLESVAPDLIQNTTTLLVGSNSEVAGNYLPTKVLNLGSTSEASELVKYYNLADVFVSASIADNFPSTCLESLACGTPVVAFDVGGIPEIVIDRKTGLLAKSKDAHDLANNIQEILADDSLCGELAINCRDYVETHLSLEKFAENYLKLFREAIGEFSDRS